MRSAKLTLPEELRDSITSYLAILDEQLRSSPEYKSEMAAAIRKLETAEREITAEIARLKPKAIQDDTAAGIWLVKERRLAEIQTATREKRQALAEFRPATMMIAGEVLMAVSVFYIGRLTSIIARELAPVCPDFNQACQIANLTPAVRALMGVRDLSYNIRMEEATTGNVENIRAILNRALKGALHLGVDLPEDSAASE